MTHSTIAIAASNEEIEKYRSYLDGKNSHWDITYFTDTVSCEDALCSQEFAIVLIDRSLSEFSENFLEGLESVQPNAQIMIAVAEEEREEWEISNGGISILPKPMNGKLLVESFQKALAIESWLGQDRIKGIVSNLDKFPSLPHMYLKVMNALNSRDSSVERIGQVISDDVGITAKILQVVNSSFFGFEEKISDITHAVNVLGIEQVKSLVLAVQVFGDSSDAGKQAVIDSLLRHSIGVANAAKRIALHQTRDEKLAGEAYTAGLLHDLGKLILLNSNFDKTKASWEAASEANESPWKHEAEALGANHAEVGAYVLGRWGMPISIVEAAAFHHQPSNGMSVSEFNSLSAVHLANAVVWGKSKDVENHPDSQLDQEYLNLLGVEGEWAFWKDVAEGNAPAKKIGLKKSAKNPESSKAKSEAFVNNVNLDTLETVVPKEEPGKSSKGLFIGLGVAASLGLFGWIAFSHFNQTTGPVFEDDLVWSNETLDTEEVGVDPFEEKVAIELAEDDSVVDEAVSVDEEILLSSAISEVEPLLEDANSVVEEVDLEPVEKLEVETVVAELPKPIIKEAEDLFPAFVLGGIFYSEANPAATLNGRIVRVGNRVSGATVVSITRKHVKLDYEGKEKILKLQ